MKINLLSIGTRMPKWVNEGVSEYSKRLPSDFNFSVTEVPMAKRGKSIDVGQAIKKESDALLSRVREQDYVVAMEVGGKVLSTEDLASRFDAIRLQGQHVALLVGGPDGLGDDCLARANEKWSLSALTLPHPLVRILVAEQVYRAWSILNSHPYHRAG